MDTVPAVTVLTLPSGISLAGPTLIHCVEVVFSLSLIRLTDAAEGHARQGSDILFPGGKIVSV